MKTSSERAALVNGTLGHYLDYDDFLIPALGAGGPHISAATFPAALAMGEQCKATGRDLIAAYVLGCEITYRVGRGVDPYHYNTGWHTTSTEGFFGAVTAAGKLLRLDRDQMAYALGISASQSAGLRENFGTSTKPFHAGHASEGGVKSAVLSRLGFTSSKRIFEARYGFCRVLSRKASPRKIITNLGRPYYISKMRLKLYPSCGATHAAIDAASLVKAGSNLDVAEIRSVRVKTSPLVQRLLPFDEPRSPPEAKFSMPYCLAIALMRGDVALGDFTDERIRSDQVVQLMRKVNLVPENKLSDLAPTVEVRCRDGTTESQTVRSAKGTPENPLSETELVRKYRNCARLRFDDNQLERSLDELLNLDSVSDVSKLAIVR